MNFILQSPSAMLLIGELALLAAFTWLNASFARKPWRALRVQSRSETRIGRFPYDR
jgi:hypothetical protein